MNTIAIASTPFVSSPAVARPAAITGTPKWLLRGEGFVMLLAAVVGYRTLGGGWGLFAACFLLPDLSLLGYLAGARVGAVVYNAGHSLFGPAVLAAIALLASSTGFGLAALIWVAHIGFDRLAGYGLKYGSSFFDTHLGRVGREQA